MLADSHIHLFKGGYKNSGEPELEIYLGFLESHSIEHALVVGYEGASWADENNSYLANLQETNSWIHALAYSRPATLTIESLESFRSQGFIGVSLYLFEKNDIADLEKVSTEVWQWLVLRNWIVSVNSTGKLWLAWLAILRENPNLLLLISHMGLPFDPNGISIGSSAEVALQPMEQVCRFPNVYLKLSGFYALDSKKPAFPYTSLTPYFEEIIATVPIDRLIWGSDFPAALTCVDFAQTFENLYLLPFLNPIQLSKILGLNLVKILSPLS